MDQQVFVRFLNREKRRQAAVEQLQEIVSEFPDLLEQLLNESDPFHGNITPAPRPTTHASVNGQARASTAFQRVVKLFIDRDNPWVDTGEVSRESSVSRNAVAHILWSAHKDEFEQKPHPTHQRMKLWRMKPESFDKYSKQARLFDGEEKILK
ncbi:MAG TPA: hypothetical protein VG269_19390 [Tepidisphaeraceae bacterium]|jgi:hypothetical protein|nr:hypothetical protein [Tepidisphaeraceae bacterium]